jgi:hypothetical protein
MNEILNEINTMINAIKNQIFWYQRVYDSEHSNMAIQQYKIVFTPEIAMLRNTLAYLYKLESFVEEQIERKSKNAEKNEG